MRGISFIVINHVISFFDKKIKIFILGFCDGANIAAGAFNNINIEINKLIFWNPNILFNKENDKNDEINITYISKINKYCIDFQGVYMNFMFYKDIIHNQLFDFIINNEEYCHIFLASNDNSYINYNNILIKKPQKKIKHLEIINGGGHLFFSTETENMLFKKTINCILE